MTGAGRDMRTSEIQMRARKAVDLYASLLSANGRFVALLDWCLSANEAVSVSPNHRRAGSLVPDFSRHGCAAECGGAKNRLARDERSAFRVDCGRSGRQARAFDSDRVLFESGDRCVVHD